MRYGIDVSHYQNSIDWQRVKTTGKVDFVIMKAMYESNKAKDETFEANYAGATNAGINRGVYNFIGSVSASNPKADAKALLEILNGRKLEFGIWLDLESDKVRALGKEKIEDIVEKERRVFEAAGYTVGIYCNYDWYKNVISDKIKDVFAGKFWIARYPKNDKGEVVNKLSPKNSCPESIGWQYSSKGNIDGITTKVDLDMFWGEVNSEIPKNVYSRTIISDNCEKYIGAKNGSTLHLEILNIYNGNKPLPRGYAVKPTDAWCATFGSAMFILAGYQDIFPIECSCNKMIEKARSMGIWVEQDGYVPNIGDAILYDWQDNGVGDNTGSVEHVGIVTYVNKDAGYIVVTEGNYSKSVKKRTININGRYIRGYVTPKFDTVDVEVSTTVNEQNKSVNEVAHEVIAGQWGSGDSRRVKLAAAGYDYSVIQQEVNKILNNPSKATTNAASTIKVVESSVKPSSIDSSISGTYKTTANLYMRNGAGTNKKMLVKIPKGTSVKCNGYYSTYNGIKWFYIEAVVNGVKYIGFSCSTYLRR